MVMKQVEIIPYNSTYKQWVKDLNYEWLTSYFKVEEGDVRSLSDPDKYIIEPGGFIFLAKNEDGVIGTASLLFKERGVYELGKMAVKEGFRGKGIGDQLLSFCIRFAKSHHWDKLILYSNTILQPAIHLYKKYGFVEIELEQGLYERANIKMQLDLNKLVGKNG